MVGRIINSRRKVINTRNVPQLRQTKLVLRVTAKRLTYKTKNAIVRKHLEEQSSDLKSECPSDPLGNNDPGDSENNVADKGELSTSGQSQESNAAPSGEIACRPKRNVFPKRTEACGLSWKEETELKKALYASLQRKKIKPESNNVFNDGHAKSESKNSNNATKSLKRKFCNERLQSPEVLTHVSLLESKRSIDSNAVLFSRGRNCGLFRAQRKFACGSKPGGGSLASRRRFPRKLDCSLKNDQNVPYTEDFIDYLCLRGTPFLPESLKYFDKILCRNVDNHLETPESCSSADILLPTATMKTTCDVHRRWPRATLRKSSGLKNKEFTNAENSPEATHKSLPCESIEKHRPLTRSLAKKVPEAFDGQQTFDSDVVDCYDSNHEDDDDDDVDGDDEDDDDDKSEGLSEVLSCFVQDDQHPVFFNKDSIDQHYYDNNDREPIWICNEENLIQNGFDNPMSCSDDKLNPGDGHCSEQSVDVAFDYNHHGVIPSDGSDEDDDDDVDTCEKKCELFCLNPVRKIDECAVESLISCQTNCSEIGTCIGAVNKCVGTDNTDFLSNSMIELSLRNHFPVDETFSHQLASNLGVMTTSLNGLGGCMLSMSQNLPFKCIIPANDKAVHDASVILANVPVVSMTSLSSVLVVPPVHNVNQFIQISSPPLFAPWHASVHESPSPLVLAPAKIFGSTTLELSPKESLSDGFHSLRKIAPKVSAEVSTTSSSLEFGMSCQACPPMSCYGGPNIQLIDEARTCASDSSLKTSMKQSELTKAKVFFKRHSRRQTWKSTSGPVTSSALKVSENDKISSRKDLSVSCIQISTAISLRSGKVINVEPLRNETKRMEDVLAPITSDDDDDNNCTSPSNIDGSASSRTVKRLQVKRTCFTGHRKKAKKQKTRRRRRTGIEMIDRSWNRSNIKKCAEVFGDVKLIRPVTRSRTLASLEDELMRAKMEVEGDCCDDEDDDD